MALYMKNRSGVVFYAKEDLLKNRSLDFAYCKVDGSDLDPETTPTPLQAGITAQTKKKSTKGK